MKNLSLNKGRPHCLCILLFAVLLSNNMYGAELTFTRYEQQLQQQIIGIVSDASGPLSNVSVNVKGTNVFASTNDKGEFTITVKPSDILVFSFVGFTTQEIVVGNQTSINVLLIEYSTQLEEITINAGYYSVKEKETTGSIARITSKDIETQPITNVLAAMQGRMAGVNVIQTTGVPGGTFDIQIRGQNSLRTAGNAPLYVVDGVPYSSEPIGTAGTTIVMPGAANPISTLSPSEIESIEILKDADATAIYGSRGANGVVLITTRKGKAGATKFSAGISQGVGHVTRFMDLMNTQQYLDMRREAFANDNITNYPANAYDVNGTWDENRYTDWQKVLTGGTSEITDAQASISGGSEKTQFSLNGNYHRETTVFPGDFNFNRGALRASFNHKADNDRFKISFTAGYTTQNNNLPGTDLTRESRTLAPNAPELYDENGELNWANGSWSNPLRILNSEYLAKTKNLVANSVLSYAIVKNLEARVNLGYTELHHDESRTLPSTLYNPSSGLGPEYSSLYVVNTDRESWIVEPQINWEMEYGNSKVAALAGATFQKQQNRQVVHEASGFTSNSLIHSLAAAANVFVTDNIVSEYNYQAFYGRINYNYNSRYLLNFTGRRDGSSRFGPGKQFAWFGAAGAGWIFSNESFLKDNKVLSFGKLRASYGSSGNDQIGDYQFLDTYTVSGNNYQGTIGLQPTQLYNANFGWETNRKFEIAIESGFFRDRIFLTAAWYRNRSSNQLVGIPLPGTTGFSSLQANLDATVENTGVEFTLRTSNIQNKDFSWTTSLNISAQRNKLLSFPDLEGSTYANQFVIGQPLNIRLTYNSLGVDPQTGAYQFEDVDGDGQITSAGDRKTVKDLNPKYFGGLQNEIRYKRWNLDFLFQFVRQDNLTAPAMFGRPGSLSNQPAGLADRWTQAGDSSTYQMVTNNGGSEAGRAYNFYQSSDAAIGDASYIRLKNIALSYDLPEDIVYGMRCRLYVQAQNLLTFT